MMRFQENAWTDRRMEERVDGRMEERMDERADGPCFIGPFRLPSGVQK